MWCFIGRSFQSLINSFTQNKPLEMACGIKLAILNRLRMEGKYLDMAILVNMIWVFSNIILLID